MQESYYNSQYLMISNSNTVCICSIFTMSFRNDCSNFLHGNFWRTVHISCVSCIFLVAKKLIIKCGNYSDTQAGVHFRWWLRLKAENLIFNFEQKQALSRQTEHLKIKLIWCLISSRYSSCYVNGTLKLPWGEGGNPCALRISVWKTLHKSK